MEDLAIISERQLVKGISRVIAVTGGQAKQVRKGELRFLLCQGSARRTQLCGFLLRQLYLPSALAGASLLCLIWLLPSPLYPALLPYLTVHLHFPHPSLLSPRPSFFPSDPLFQNKKSAQNIRQSLDCKFQLPGRYLKV